MSYHPKKNSTLKYNESSEGEMIFDLTNKFEVDSLFQMINVMILESCRDEVDILNSSYQKVLTEKQPVIYSSIEKRYGFANEILHERNMKIKLGSTQSDYSRMCTILILLKDVIEYGISDLLVNKSYKMMSQAVDDMQRMKDDEAALLSSFNLNYELNSKLMQEVVTDKFEALGHIRETDNEIYRMREKSAEFFEEAAMKYNTVRNWEKSRQEQNIYIHKTKENTYENDIQQKQKLIRDEKKANGEMMKFYEEHMKDLQEDIIKWMAKYEQDMEAKDIEILKQRIEVENMKSDLTELQQTILKKQKEMDDWVELRNSRIEAEIRNALENFAAKKIQRWWRNILHSRKPKQKSKKKIKKEKNKKFRK